MSMVVVFAINYGKSLNFDCLTESLFHAHITTPLMAGVSFWLLFSMQCCMNQTPLMFWYCSLQLSCIHHAGERTQGHTIVWLPELGVVSSLLLIFQWPDLIKIAPFNLHEKLGNIVFSVHEKEIGLVNT